MKNNSHVEGGPKTDQGKAVTRYNALTHGILRDTLTDYEKDVEMSVLDELRTDLAPQGYLEGLLIERVATHYVKLRRIAKAEREYVQSILDPRRVTKRRIDPFDLGQEVYEETVENEGYTPELGIEAVERLNAIYSRYETSIENRFYRAIRELRDLRVKTVS